MEWLAVPRLDVTIGMGQVEELESAKDPNGHFRRTRTTDRAKLLQCKRWLTEAGREIHLLDMCSDGMKEPLD
jgi:hypothetical protein